MRRRSLLGAGAGVAAGLAAEGRCTEATLVERLGHPATTRLLMVHADDVGMSHAVNAASHRALTEGIVSSASVMVPCPWLLETVAWSKANPKADLGLHLTLTSEWKHYRWGPVAPRERVPGLIDPEGYLWHSPEQVRQHARPEEVEIEIQAQIDRAVKLGLRPTHIDSHMGTLFEDSRYFEVYTRVARETGIVPMIPAPTPDILREVGEPLADQYREAVKRLQAAGYVIIDRLVLTLTEPTPDTRLKEFQELVKSLKPGVTELICHLAEDGEEIRHISGAWQRRVHDYAVMMSPDARTILREQNVRLVGYRELGRLFRPV